MDKNSNSIKPVAIREEAIASSQVYIRVHTVEK